MKLLSLTDLSLIMILAFSSNGQDWNITLPTSAIVAEKGSDVTIFCHFTYPPEQKSDSLRVYWKWLGRQINIADNDKFAFVYHPNDTFVLEKYRNKTKLIGDIHNGNCSLHIQKVESSDEGLYVRLETKSDKYSFNKYRVSICIDESGVTLPPLPTAKTPNVDFIFVAIFVPLSALVIILLIIGVYCSIKRKRSQAFIREESGYYANFSRPTSTNQVQRESSCKIIENKPIDEPVYVNTETLTGQSQDHSERIYANVDYSK